MRFYTIDKGVKEGLQRVHGAIASFDVALYKLALLVGSSIKRRVIESGEALNGATMFYRSPSYIKYRKEGRKKGVTHFPGGRQVSFKDLLLTGRMWRALDAQLVTTGPSAQAKIFFGSAEANAKAFGNEMRESFFGIGSKENKIINDEMVRIKKVITAVF